MGDQYKKVINSNLLVLGHRLHIIDKILQFPDKRLISNIILQLMPVMIFDI